MAPTEILATGILENRPLAEPLGVKSCCCNPQLGKTARWRLPRRQARLVIGAHAPFEEVLPSRRASAASRFVDEQHRFGVGGGLLSRLMPDGNRHASSDNFLLRRFTHAGNELISPVLLMYP